MVGTRHRRCYAIAHADADAGRTSGAGGKGGTGDGCIDGGSGAAQLDARLVGVCICQPVDGAVGRRQRDRQGGRSAIGIGHRKVCKRCRRPCGHRLRAARQTCDGGRVIHRRHRDGNAHGIAVCRTVVGFVAEAVGGGVAAVVDVAEGAIGIER